LFIIICTETTPKTVETSFPESDIKELVNFGFTRSQVIEELQKFNGDKNQAMASLFSKSFTVPK
jgi:hypothetical protein